MSLINRMIKILLICIGCLLVIIIGYVLYLLIQFNRIEDNYDLTTEIQNNQGDKISLAQDYSIVTYNIGFGAYDQDFSFFMDEGVMKDGRKVTGKYSKARSNEVVLTNINGIIDTLKEDDFDFMFFQEVDEHSTRSFYINQLEMIRSNFQKYGSVYAQNFHSAYLFYPFNDPHGKVNGGVLTLSKHLMTSSVRRSFPIDLSFPTKFFDLDRCFTITRLEVTNGKQLVLINLHMSAYDEGGTIRQLQLDLLNKVLREEYDKGNFVIAGGDFNHDITSGSVSFDSLQEKPEWVQTFSNSDIINNYYIGYSDNAPTCRSSDIPYEKGVNYTVIIDGFIISDNIEMVNINNIDLDFEYSDHNPVKMTFKLRS